MLIDWFTVGAQALNFLILVWLMKRFLYTPILHAIDARETLIAKELAEAAASKAEAQKEHEEFHHKNEELDTQRAALLSTASEEASAERQRLLDEARHAADALSTKRQDALKTEARGLEQSLARRTQYEVFAIARKVLTDLASTGLEERMAAAFTQRLRSMDGQPKADMGEALKAASGPALVRSAFDLPLEQREAIQRAINETFSADIHLRFETAPDLVSGIDLAANGQRVGWSIGSYLTSMDESVSELLKTQERPAPQAEPTSSHTTDQKPEAAAAPTPDAKVEPRVAAHSEPMAGSPTPEPHRA